MVDTVSKQFLEEYLKLLSPDSFCIVLRFYFFYLSSKEKGSDLQVPFSVFQKHILVSEDKERIEYAWGELSYWNLVKRVYQQNLYELNVGKIENNTEKFRVILKDDVTRIRRKRNIADYLEKYVEKIVTSFSNPRLAEKVAEVITGHIKFLLNEKGRVELQDIKFLTDLFFEVPQQVLEKTCDVYITSYYAKKPAVYIHGIMKKIQSERQENKEEDFKTLNLKQYRQELDESNKELAMKIALGEISENKSYQAYIKLKDFRSLNKLYQAGIKSLIEQGRADLIHKAYEWLEKNNAP